eukprot:TRINITY_DN62367_c1_g1_i1.p1 TRINITY_DN62367_c1_g1~~TRINITY_DN62367_c1_g1_i1.p1  ORF type:complete len:102 (+),score=1.05 TRINITY_DN62367_c1_g1_i1:779-1084(+)
MDQMGKIRVEKKYTLTELREKEDEALSKSNKYEMLDRKRDAVNIVFIGHVDAGKSTLAGRVLVETKEVDEQELKQFKQEAAKNKRENWYLSYVLDINEDEK